MALVKNLINQAYAQIGSISDDEEADGTDGALGVQILNQIINQANTEQLFPFMQTITSYPIVTSQASYTIGDTGDIVAERPEFISRSMFASTSTSNPTPIRQMGVSDLLLYVTQGSGTPNYFGYNAEYPDGKIYFDQSPTAGGVLTLVYTKAFPVVTIDTDLTTVPPKYDSFIVYSLARALSVHKKRPPEIVSNCAKLYEDSLQYIKISNSRAQVPMFDLANAMSFSRKSFLEGR